MGGSAERNPFKSGFVITRPSKSGSHLNLVPSKSWLTSLVGCSKSVLNSFGNKFRLGLRGEESTLDLALETRRSLLIFVYVLLRYHTLQCVDSPSGSYQ